MLRAFGQGESEGLWGGEHQQARVSLFGLAVTFLAGPALLLQLFSRAIGGALQLPSLLAYAAAAFVAAFTWRHLREKPRAPLLVSALDATTAIASSASFQLMAMEIPAPARPDLIATIITLLLMIARVVIVPSTPRRTLVISGTMTASLMAVSYLAMAPYVRNPESPLYPYRHEMVLWTIVWGAIGTGLMVLASRALFGLRREVQRARRLGQYVLGERLGAGGMGEVFRAQHAMLRRPTAVKILHPSAPAQNAAKGDARTEKARGAASPDRNALALVRFEREVKITASLTHPNTITVYDYGHTPEGLFYYAMELLDGADLEKIVEATGPMPPGRVIFVLQQVLAALAEAHDRGLIHRDIKPSNIVLCSRGGLRDFVKVLDFGLVKEAGPDAHMAAVSVADEIVGTPLYMPPEAMKSASELDARSDIYALGAVAYFLLTGTPVFTGATLLEIAAHHFHTLPESPSARAKHRFPDDLESLVLQCLCKEPADRPASALALAEALGRCASANDWSQREALAWWQHFGETVGAAAHPPSEAVTEKDQAPLALTSMSRTVHFQRRQAPARQRRPQPAGN